jgi:hypothetical protein
MLSWNQSARKEGNFWIRWGGVGRAFPWSAPPPATIPNSLSHRKHTPRDSVLPSPPHSCSGRPVPEATLSMHRVHCARNTTKCGHCGKAVATRELDAHIAAEKGTAAAMVAAIAAGDALGVSAMLAHGAPLLGPCDASSGDTPLHVAARHRRIAILDLLLGKGCSVNVANTGGETPLHAACASRDPTLAAAAAATISGAGVGAGGIAAGEAGIVRSGSSRPGSAGLGGLGAGSGAPVLGTVGAAALLGSGGSPADALTDVVGFLLRRGCDVEARTVLGDTPIQVAQRCRNADVLLMLSSSGGGLRAVS